MSIGGPQEFTGQDANDFAATHLVKLRTDLVNWETWYEDPATHDHWLMDYPHSYAHGGGPPRLRFVGSGIEKQKMQLHTELWTSWASVLRSYAACHGLNSPQHAVVEVSAYEITLRVGAHWLRFTATELQHDDQPAIPFALQENGTVVIDNASEEEMDIAAERFAREMLSA